MKLQASKNMFYVRLCLSAILAMLLSACATPPPSPEATPTAAENQPMAALPPEPPPLPSPAALPAPTPAEVSAAINRLYKDAVRVSTTPTPGFVVGDFNGDQSQDIAVIVEPVKEKLDDLNSEVAAWLIRDPLSTSQPPAIMAVSAVSQNEPPVRTTIAASDAVLLAVIHGYGPQGWRDQQAQQTYLLKNAAGSDMAVQPRRAAIAALKTPPPPARGDVIKATMAGAGGFLYFDSATYAWYDPRTYRGEAPKRLAH